MDLVTSTELAVQLCGFRNIDLLSQGIYQLRFSAIGTRFGRAAVPLDVQERHGPKAQLVLPAHVLKVTNEFCSPAFRVRYCEEEVCHALADTPTPYVRLQLKMLLLAMHHTGPVLRPRTLAIGPSWPGASVPYRETHARTLVHLDAARWRYDCGSALSGAL